MEEFNPCMCLVHKKGLNNVNSTWTRFNSRQIWDSQNQPPESAVNVIFCDDMRYDNSWSVSANVSDNIYLDMIRKYA